MGGVPVGMGEGGRAKEGGSECSVNGGDEEKLLFKVSPTVS